MVACCKIFVLQPRTCRREAMNSIRNKMLAENDHGEHTAQVQL